MMKLRLLTNLFPPRSSINFFLGNDHSRIWLLIWNIHSCKIATLQARGLEGWGDFKTSTSKNRIFLRKFWIENFINIKNFIFQKLGFSIKIENENNNHLEPCLLQHQIDFFLKIGVNNFHDLEPWLASISFNLIF